MTDRTIERSADAPKQHASAFAPACLWLIVQFLVLAPGLIGWPLWARMSALAERHAAHELFAGLVIASGLLFPLLFRDLRCTIILMVLTLPAIDLAGRVSQIEFWPLAAATAYLLAWMGGLALWARALDGRAALIGVAAAGLLTVGWPVICYLSAEFGGGSQHALTCGPAAGAIAQITSGDAVWRAWLIIAAVAGSGGAAVVIRGRKRFTDSARSADKNER